MSAEIEVPGQPPGEALSESALVPVAGLVPIAGAVACWLLEGVRP